MRFVRWQGFAFVFLACSLSALAAERIAVVTLLEGPAALVRGTTRYALAEGVRFRPGDIIEVSEKGLARDRVFRRHRAGAGTRRTHAFHCRVPRQIGDGGLLRHARRA